MGLKIVEENLDAVDEKFHDLYTEKDGKFHLTGVDGMKTQEDITRLQGALTKERNDHKKVRDQLSSVTTALGGREIEDVVADLERIPTLEAAAEGKIDNTKIDQLVETRLNQKLAPVKRELETTKQKLVEKEGVIETFSKKEKTRAIHDAVRSAATTSKVLPEALDDALMLAERVFEVQEDGSVVTKENVGVTPGIEANVWLTEVQSKRPHWWGQSQGGGAPGNRGGNNFTKNPWSAENWNMTEQGKILRENPTKAEQMAKSAGTTVGGKKPAPKK